MTHRDGPTVDLQVEQALNDPAALAAFVEDMATMNPGMEQAYVGGYSEDEFCHATGFWAAYNARRQAESAAMAPPPTRRPRTHSAMAVINASMGNL